MAIVDILLRVVPEAEDEGERLAMAADLAIRLGARLEGVYIDTGNSRAARAARVLFRRAASETSLETSWRIVDGCSDDALGFQSRRADLTILPPGLSIRGNRSCRPEAIAVETGRPVLVLPPPSGSPMSIGHKIMVAWNGSREAARAIHDSLPILLLAERVHVLTVIGEGEPDPMIDLRLLEHLQEHGVAAELERRYGDPAEEIASRIRDLGVDMLVIGLHVASGSDQPAVAGVSYRFLRTASLPVFFSN